MAILIHKKFKELKKTNKELMLAIQLKCADCVCFFEDPYQKCEIENCPLLKYYPTFGKAMVLKKFKDNLKNRKTSVRGAVCKSGKDK